MSKHDTVEDHLQKALQNTALLARLFRLESEAAIHGIDTSLGYALDQRAATAAYNLAWEAYALINTAYDALDSQQALDTPAPEVA